MRVYLERMYMLENNELEEIKENDYDDSQYHTNLDTGKSAANVSQILLQKRIKPIRTDDNSFIRTKVSFGPKRF